VLNGAQAGRYAGDRQQQGAVVTPAQQALFDFAQRMDEIALCEPKDKSWEEIFKEARRDLNGRIGAAASAPIDAATSSRNRQRATDSRKGQS
jgi:hypothetical protein